MEAGNRDVPAPVSNASSTSSKPTRMPFGMHKGRSLDAIPPGYLQWVLRECRTITPALRQAIEEELRSRGCSHEQAQQHDQQQPGPTSKAMVNVEAIIRAAHRAMTL